MPDEQFAIRPTLRNHNTLTRDSIIKQVASIVGPGHEVNLRDYELLIVVEVYQVSGNMRRSQLACSTDSGRTFVESASLTTVSKS